jgi:hypothetical protein
VNRTDLSGLPWSWWWWWTYWRRGPMSVTTWRHVFGNLLAKLDNHGSQDHEITWFLWKQLLFHETAQENATWMKVWTEEWPTVPTAVTLGVPIWYYMTAENIVQQKILNHISSIWRGAVLH